MPLLDIATAQPSFRNNLYPVRCQTYENEKLGSIQIYSVLLLPGKEKKFNSFKTQHCGFVIKGIATLEHKRSFQKKDGALLGIDSRNFPAAEDQSSSEDLADVDSGEILRRMRISKANKGNTPWNKGRKHSPETLQRIRERTRLAMQDPKVKMKLVNLGHAQSEETRIKIGAGVRIGWERRREKLMLQETCYFEWQNLIAEASRKGLLGEEELQWDSYKILDERLEQEWLERVGQKKKMPRPKGSKRAPKSPEQRRKISEAIAAKWADPVYRDRVYYGLSKFYGTPVGVEKPSRRAASNTLPRKRSPPKKKTNDVDITAGDETKNQNQWSKLRRKNNGSLYKDPQANSKLEMIKSIRAQRATVESTKSEAVTRAKLLIAEAEKAAESLEIAAKTSPLARASLMETRKLIAEAIKSIESTEMGKIHSQEIKVTGSLTSLDLVNNCEDRIEVERVDRTEADDRETNGFPALTPGSGGPFMDFSFGKLNIHHFFYGKNDDLASSSNNHAQVNGKEHLYGLGSSDLLLPSFKLDGVANPDGSNSCQDIPRVISEQGTNETTKAKRKTWVRGKLVEVDEED